MHSVAIVILNYKAYYETEKCIESIIKKKLDIVGIVVVDNASENESISYLKLKYQHNKKIRLIKCGKNYGFAKGNNIGIKVAKDTWGAEFVLLLNSDVMMLEEDYIQKMLNGYEEGIGVLQSSALRINGRYTQKSYGIYDLRGMIYEAIRDFCQYYNFYFLNKIKPAAKVSMGPWVSGCDLLLTPDYFRIFRGLYPLTFLYGEEYILAIMLKKAGLKWKVVETAHILHAESKSTPIDFKEGTRKKRKMMLETKKHKFLVRMLPLKIICRIVNYEK